MLKFVTAMIASVSIAGCVSTEARQAYDHEECGAPTTPAIESLLAWRQDNLRASVDRWMKYKNDFSLIDADLESIAWDVATGEAFPGHGASHVHYALDSYLALWINFEYDDSKGYNVITGYDVYRNGGWIKDGNVLVAVHYNGRWMRRVAIGRFVPVSSTNSPEGEQPEE